MLTHDVVFLPGIIAPAARRYAPLLHLLVDVNPVVKDLEVYRADAPPAGYSIATEMDGVLRVADEAGVERFHLYGHSAGGAVALALALTHGDRVLTLASTNPRAISPIKETRTTDGRTSTAFSACRRTSPRRSS